MILIPGIRFICFSFLFALLLLSKQSCLTADAQQLSENHHSNHQKQLDKQARETSAKIQPLRVSDNGRYLCFQDGSPFFYLADTGWELFHRLNFQESERYLRNRADKGFTVIQAVILAELSGLDTANANGDRPLLNNDPAYPIEKYFQHVDRVIGLAADLGIYMAVLPTWGDKLNKSSWGLGPEIFDSSNIYFYGKYLGNRYKDRHNIIWVIGGDRDPRDSSNDVAVWRSLAMGITDGVGGGDRALMTFHPQTSSSRWFHEEDWLDFNMFQSSHCPDRKVWKNIEGDYKRVPVKPVLDGEPLYEEIPLCFDMKNGYSQADEVRRKAYQNLFAGAAGHTYGCNNIWQMYAPGRTGILNPLRPWYESLDLPGAMYMSHVKKLMVSRSMKDRIPSPSLLISNTEDPKEWKGALKGTDYAMIYTSSAKAFQVNLDELKSKKILCSWFNPRTGNYTSKKTIANKGIMKFTPPGKNKNDDWVLMLDFPLKK